MIPDKFSKFSQFLYPLKSILLEALTAEEPMKTALLEGVRKELRHEETVTKWTDARGDQTHRLLYDLNPESIVFDVGGYKGEWAASIYCMHSCKIHIFEPHPAFVSGIKEKFGKNPNIKVHQIGLSKENKEVQFTFQEDGTTLFPQKPGEVLYARVLDVLAFMNDNGFDTIDLMKLNVEGAEYDILERLIDAGAMNRVKNLQVQFHNFIPDAEERRTKIQDSLGKTHYQTYNFDFVWEGWTRK
jgi:FkbM family methyltransferase